MTEAATDEQVEVARESGAAWISEHMLAALIARIEVEKARADAARKEAEQAEKVSAGLCDTLTSTCAALSEPDGPGMFYEEMPDVARGLRKRIDALTQEQDELRKKLDAVEWLNDPEAPMPEHLNPENIEVSPEIQAMSDKVRDVVSGKVDPTAMQKSLAAADALADAVARYEEANTVAKWMGSADTEFCDMLIMLGAYRATRPAEETP